MAIQIRYNPEKTAIEITDGESQWAEEFTDGETTIVLENEGEQSLLVVLEGAGLDGVKENTVYKLVEVPTEILEEADIEDEDGNILGMLSDDQLDGGQAD